ncbi:MAG: flagellar filament capping protein FliD [Planctomycetaceae bacterium]|nr:flagellar filament capping protein FliD [Planctomycetaceae bacterium]
MAVTIDGLVSGLDTESIVNGLLEIQQTQLDRIQLKRSDVLAEKTAFNTLQAQLVTFRSSLASLARVQNSPFTKQSVSVSNEDVLSATASQNAASGIYRLTVNSVAKAHQVATQGFTDTEAEVSQGTLEIRLGSGDVTTITVDSTNNSLSGLADSINSSGAGVTASVVKDASGGSSPYRLLLTSSATGTDKAISITNNLAASAGDAVRPEFDFGNPVQAAEDASITLGSGAGAITVESSNNRFDDLISGVSLNVLNHSAGQELTVTVSQDTETAVSAVEDFVDSYNSLMDFIDQQTRYDAITDEGGPLQGNRSVLNIQQKIRSALVTVVPGVNNKANRLSAIGISVTDNGRLELNKSTLQGILNGGDQNISRSDLKRLFSLDVKSSRSGINFVLGSSRTEPSSGSTYQLDLTQAAKRATVSAGTALAASTVIDSSNRTLEIEVDGVETTVTLNEGTYTQQELADHLESVINGASDLNSRSVSVGLSSGTLNITSDSYGRSSTVKINGGTGLAALGFTAGTVGTGTDVAGTFIVDGQSESATGRGQLLSGNPDNEHTADLQLRILLGEADIVSGPEADLDVTRGLAAGLDQILSDILDPVDGTLKSIDDRFDDQLDSIQTSFDRQKSLFDAQQQSLIEQFVSLESSLSELQSSGDFITSQLTALRSQFSSNRN